MGRKARHRFRRFEVGRAEFIALSNLPSLGECRNDENKARGEWQPVGVVRPILGDRENGIG